MENFVYISPNYPESHWMFIRGLKEKGARVLGIIDTPYENLKDELKAYLDEAYYVTSFHDYEQVYKALAYFAWKYGKIDWVESNNEAWLELDAALRRDFNIPTGFSPEQIEELQSKQAMKKYYEKAGVPVAPYTMPKTFLDALKFARKEGYPLVLKPDHGVGASYTWKIHSDKELERFWNEAMELNTEMILEKFVNGEVMTLDGLVDHNGKIRFIASLDYVSNCMDSVQNYDSIGCYYNFSVPQEQLELAQKVISAFDLKNRFFHGEYFRLKEDVKGLGRKGDLIGLELNLRPPGGFAPDLINYSYDTDIYRLWADVLLEGEQDHFATAPHSAGFIGRREGIDYTMPTEILIEKYKPEIIDVINLPPAFAATMGDTTILARFDDPERRQAFFEDAFRRNDIEVKDFLAEKDIKN